MDNRRFRDEYESGMNRMRSDRERPNMRDRMSSYESDSNYDTRAQRLQDGQFGWNRPEPFSKDQNNSNYGFQSDMNEFRNPGMDQGRASSTGWNQNQNYNSSADFSRDHGFGRGNDFSYERENYGTRGSSRDLNARDFGSSQHVNAQRPQQNEGWMDTSKNFFGKGPKGYKRSDEKIREEISEALYRHSAIDASEIEIDVKEGIVTLTGSVEGRRMKRLVEDVVEECHGVSDVHNQLRLMPLPGMSSTASATNTAQAAGAATTGKKGAIQ